jgi:uncharacterized membrane protein YeaQ/YmgE (transglycosylase-associated protein family)
MIYHIFLGGLIGAAMTVLLTQNGRMGMLSMEAAGSAGAFVGSALGIELDRRWHARFVRVALASLGAVGVLWCRCLRARY